MLFVNLNAGIGLHQVALADALYGVLGKNYVFIEFGRKGSGQFGSYKNSSKGVDFYKDRPYILKMYESDENTRKAIELISKSHVLRTGGEPFEMVKQRILDGKLTFRSSERSLKGPRWKDLYRAVRLAKHYYPFTHLNYRILCQSAYLANDMRFLGNGYYNKCYKFAYFTQIPQLDIEKVIQSRDKYTLKIVWCARFIDWKHPEMMLDLAKRLIDSGRMNFSIKMIGADTTALWKDINSKVLNNDLSDYVILTGGMKNSEVLGTMKESNVFIFTSDRSEGWGAVLNEAMGAGCACVSSNEIGATPFLIKNNENGLIFKSCNSESLFEKVVFLYDNRMKCDELGCKAYQTITTDWSAQLAADRLVKLSESIISGHEVSFPDGPCSKAYPVNPKDLIG